MVHNMTKEDAQRIQSTQAKGGQDMSAGGFAARAQGAGDRAYNASTGSGTNTGARGGAGNSSSAGGKSGDKK